VKQATITLTLPSPVTFDVVSLQEAVDRRGQRIESFEIDVRDGSAWKTVETQTTIGHKRLLRFNAPVTSDQLRIRITAARARRGRLLHLYPGRARSRHG